MTVTYHADKRRREAEVRGLIIESATQLNCSASGNPRFRVYFRDRVSAVTQSDAAVSYDVRNYLSPSRAGKPVTVVFSRGGRIVAISAEQEEGDH